MPPKPTKVKTTKSSTAPKVTVSALTNIPTGSQSTSGEHQSLISGTPGTSSGVTQTNQNIGYGPHITVPTYSSQGLYHLINKPYLILPQNTEKTKHLHRRRRRALSM